MPLLPGAETLAYLDVDSLLRRVYGPAKRGAAFGHAKVCCTGCGSRSPTNAGTVHIAGRHARRSVCCKDFTAFGDTMIIRIWRAHADPQRAQEYEQFAQHQSLPMFRRQQGFRGVLFARDGADRVVLSFWENEAATAALAESSDYQETVRRLLATSILAGPQTVEMLEVHGGAWPTPDQES
jgi:heme-degrading monooxygenase HmoA